MDSAGGGTNSGTPAAQISDRSASTAPTADPILAALPPGERDLLLAAAATLARMPPEQRRQLLAAFQQL